MKHARYAAAAASAAAGALAAASGAHAAGFAIKEQSPTAQGAAFAGATAEAADVSYMFFNPAALSQQSGTQGMASASFIAPRSRPEDASGQTVTGDPTGNLAGGDDISEDAVAPAFYGMTSVTERLKVGVGLNAPFGFTTDYDDGWAGRYHALKSEVRTININPAVSYEPIDGVAVAAGMQAQYVDAELTNAIDIGTITSLPRNNVPRTAPTQNDGLAEVEGDDWAFGFNLGVLIEPREGTRIGAAYRSDIEHELTGRADFSSDDQIAQQIIQNSNQFNDTGATADLTTPDMLSFGVYQDVTDRIALMGEFQYTMWSDFDELRIQFDNPNQGDSVTNEDWDDSWFAAIGAKFDATENLALRTGVAYDESPIPDNTRTPRIPGANRTWLSIGADYSPTSWFAIQASYTHIFVEESTVDLAATGNNATRGSLNVDYQNSVDIGSVSAVLRF